MPVDQLNQIIAETTSEYRKGEEVTTESLPGVEVVHVYAMPHESEAHEHEVVIDLHFIKVGVNRDKALPLKAELAELVKEIPNIADGPSYIAVGGYLGSQDFALRLFALGEVLDLWKVITPETLHITGPLADRMAGSGYVMCSGLKSDTISS